MRRLPVFLSMLGLLYLGGPGGLPAALAAENLLCSTFPVYLFTRAIVGDSGSYDVRLMIDSSRGCPHDYAPTPAELERLSQAEVLVINGLGMEAFLERSLGVAKPGLKVIDASGRASAETPPAVAYVVTDRAGAMARAAAFGHNHEGPGHSEELNPHLFAAPGSALTLVGHIKTGLVQIDPERASAYEENAAKLSQELSSLAQLAGQIGQTLGHPRIIVSHSVFDYLARDLGFEIVAAIEEEDGAEPSAARLTALVKLARDRQVKAVLTDPEGNINLARTLGAETRLPVAVIDPVAAGPPDPPLDYYQKVMLTNLDVLAKLFAPAAEAENRKK